MKFEDQFEDELQVIESSIINVYRANPDLVDSQVERAVTAAIRFHNAALKGVSPSEHRLSGLDLSVFESIEEVNCSLLNGESAIAINDLIQCLKRVRKSTQRWSKKFGRQGYLNFVSEYV
jgi:hypothetical protein